MAQWHATWSLSIHALPRVTTFCHQSYIILVTYFQSTHMHKLRLVPFIIYYSFSIRTHAWVATYNATCLVSSFISFQSTHPCKLRQFLREIDFLRLTFQSAHTHELRQIRQLIRYVYLFLQSTHTHELRRPKKAKKFQLFVIFIS